MILFVQPFGLGSPGGGARILRALLDDAPMQVVVVCASPEPPPIVDRAHEMHLPVRPYFGRIERTRFASLPEMVAPFFRKTFCDRLERICRKFGVAAVHAIPHSRMDFHHAHRVASKLGLPFYLQVHDDFSFSSRGRVDPARAEEGMRSAWADACARFVICDQIGEEYCRRYGKRDYFVVTDGLDRIASDPAQRSPDRLRIYFMGLFHLEYEENLRVLCAALDRIRQQRPSIELSITLRCGTLRPEVARGLGDFVKVLPFGSEADVQADLERADLLYLPLPFGQRFEPFVRFSLSTKVVTYLGNGRPILYHGPSTAAVYDLLAENSAALLQTSLDVDSLVGTLGQICDDPGSADAISTRALQLARNRFMLQDQREKFWGGIAQSSSAARLCQVSNAS